MPKRVEAIAGGVAALAAEPVHAESHAHAQQYGDEQRRGDPAGRSVAGREAQRVPAPAFITRRALAGASRGRCGPGFAAAGSAAGSDRSVVSGTRTEYHQYHTTSAISSVIGSSSVSSEPARKVCDREATA